MRIIGVLITMVSMFINVVDNFIGLPLPVAIFGLLDFTSFIQVIGVVIGSGLMAYGSEFGIVFKISSTKEETIIAIGISRLAVRVSIGSGFIGMLIGWISMLGNTGGSGMDIGALTGGAATSLITILYGLTFAFCLFLPLQYYFQSQLDKDS